MSAEKSWHNLKRPFPDQHTASISKLTDLPDIASEIGMELPNQYVLGYKPQDTRHDRAWRKIIVKLNAPRGLPPVKVYARSGYYAPAE